MQGLLKIRQVLGTTEILGFRRQTSQVYCRHVEDMVQWLGLRDP